MKCNIKKYPIFKWLCIVFFIFVSVLLIWYLMQTPSNDREWSLDQQILPYASMAVDNDEFEVYNIRNFKYTTTQDYTSDYYNQTYKLSEIETLDYIVEPFGNMGAAHTFLSFGFANGDYLAISVEIRKEIGESFSPLKGLLRNYELMYVVADERDVLKLRSNYRKHDVYLYPVQTTTETMQKVLVDILNRLNKLKTEPEFYNTLTNTCTTNIVQHANEIVPGRIPFDWRMLLPEYSDELAYNLGIIDNSVPLEEMRRRHKINDLALKYADSEDFSKMIRQYDKQ